MRCEWTDHTFVGLIASREKSGDKDVWTGEPPRDALSDEQRARSRTFLRRMPKWPEMSQVWRVRGREGLWIYHYCKMFYSYFVRPIILPSLPPLRGRRSMKWMLICQAAGHRLHIGVQTPFQDVLCISARCFALPNDVAHVDERQAQRLRWIHSAEAKGKIKDN